MKKPMTLIDLDMLKHILNTKDLTSADTLNFISKNLMTASSGSQYPVVKFLLTYYKGEALQFKTNECFLLACRSGRKDMVESLLLDDELPVKANARVNNDMALMNACLGGNIDIIKFLLTSPLLKDHCHLKSYNYGAFKQAYKMENLSLMEFFLDECSMKVTIPLRKWVKAVNQCNYKYQKETLQLLDRYALSRKINQLPPSANAKRIKI